MSDLKHTDKCIDILEIAKENKRLRELVNTQRKENTRLKGEIKEISKNYKILFDIAF